MTLQEIQDEQGPLWFEIQAAITDASTVANARIAEFGSQVETLTAERDGFKATIETFLAADEARRAELIENAVKTANQKRLDELEAEIAEDKAELARDEAERERLKSQT